MQEAASALRIGMAGLGFMRMIWKSVFEREKVEEKWWWFCWGW